MSFWHPKQWWRLCRLSFILGRVLLHPGFFGRRWWVKPISLLLWPFARRCSRGKALRLTFVRCGPLFIKLGQLLSTRRDMLPIDVADELKFLQDRVPPFSGEVAKKIIERALAQSIDACFSDFSVSPLASASIAQVHAATLTDGTPVVIKVLRPHIAQRAARDISAMYLMARLVAFFWRSSQRLRLQAVVREFERVTIDELDLQREAANASQLKRFFAQSQLLYVPTIYWDYTRSHIMVSERVGGIPVSDIQALTQRKVDFKLLAERGVEIFFTQVFRDRFFHADMHAGNIFVDAASPADPTYIAVDFGIMGTLTDNDQAYLAQMLLAFFKRDYQAVATLHVDSGWVPANTRTDEFESSIRAVCEPIFERPLKEISFARFLLKLFQTAERFQMPVQPQLVLLQKTLMQVEGLGRQLYPELDLWVVAKPILEKFVRSQQGCAAQIKQLLTSVPNNLQHMSHVPALFEQLLRQQVKATATAESLECIQKKPHRYRLWGLGLGCVLASVLWWMFPMAMTHGWVAAFGVALLLFSV